MNENIFTLCTFFLTHVAEPAFEIMIINNKNCLQITRTKQEQKNYEQHE